MPDHNDELARVAALRKEREGADERLRAVNRRRTAIEAELNTIRRRADAGPRAAELERDLERVTAEVNSATRRLAERTGALTDLLDRFPGLDDPARLIGQWDDRIPILLLPVRVETRFMPVTAPSELWVRIFPDDIAVHAHEPELTAEELAAGRRYWEATEKTAAWQALAGSTEGPRAAWIAVQTNPMITSDEEQSGEHFWADFAAANGALDDEHAAWQRLVDRHGPTRARSIAERTAPNPAAGIAIDRLDTGSAAATWTRAPRSNVMPDRFAVIVQSAGRPDRTTFGARVPDPLILGPDPSASTPDIDQIDGDIQLSGDLRWMHDFDEAVRVGMALKIPLSATEASAGFDRLFVLGLRLSADPETSQRQIESLIDNHHYSPDGAAFIPQGVPTNNTGSGGSGFRRASDDPAASEAVEVGDPLFAPADDVDARRDAQWLAEALGIGYAPLMHLEHANRQDVREARLMNQALWHATAGYYLEQMLGLAPARVREIERFFVDHVSGRGPLPAIRVGSQPYGVLLTSDTRRWRVADPPGASSVARDVHDLIQRLRGIWDAALPAVSFAGKPGDSHAHLLDMLGLHPTSVDYFRRHAVGHGYLWNYATFLGWGAATEEIRQRQLALAQQLLAAVGQPAPAPLPIVDLTFWAAHSHIVDPIVCDIAETEDERFSETDAVRHLYKLAGSDALHNYLGWLHESSVAEIKAQTFLGNTSQALPIPRALLYRLMRHALLLANVDAALQLYELHGAVTELARREVELPNVETDRTVTRWEFLEARVDRVLPQLSDRPLQVVEFLGTPAGQSHPLVSGLVRVRAALQTLVDLPTARLERLLAEHVDLCSYRIDAWQTALFTQRLRALRDPLGTGQIADRAMGVHLGAFGWLEDVRPGALATPVDPAVVPDVLREPQLGVIVEQPDSGGAIHGFSTTHAVAAAVLRNAYLTHASPAEPEVMSVDLSSERVRLATSYLEGISNGQSLGALLGYQFQRGLKERHGDPSLAEFLPNFRDAYPMRADKITADADGHATTLKEANNVFDGYRLLERTLLAEPPIGYPYDVVGLPSDNTAKAAAIKQEVERMALTMDAVGDLALAEGVYQVAQGNYDRAGAMVQALARGTQPPEPEIARTPRSGAAVTHRVALHLNPNAPASVWSAIATPRSRAEPALNAWLGDRLGDPATIRFVVRHGANQIEDTTGSLADLALEPVDVLHVIGDEIADGESELVRRIRHAYRLAHGGADASALQVLVVAFPERHPDWGVTDRSLFEMMPLLTALRRLVTAARPLGAGDYMLPSEDDTNPAVDPNSQRFDAADMDARLSDALFDLSAARDQLALAISDAAVIDVTTTPADRATGFKALIEGMRALAPFGFTDAFVDARAVPEHGGEFPTPFERTLAQHLALGSSVQRQADQRLAEARRLKNFTDLDAAATAALTTAQRVERFREAARHLLGADFNLLPRFTFKNASELTAARTDRDQAIEAGPLRHSANPMIVEEWFQGVACVRERLQTLEMIAAMSDAMGSPFPLLRPLQLPFRAGGYWVAVQYPESFKPVGDVLSIVQYVQASGFDPIATQTGLLIDAWTETIPGRVETTGIAVHYNQPNAHPPQVVLLAVTPELTGRWTWDALVGVVGDTLRRAKLRAVEPDQLQSSALGHFLPAILTPSSSRPTATVTADLVHQSSVAFEG